jgi:long-chain acyl-CoA synthetase
VREVSTGLKAIGFRPGDVACVIAETRPEWVHIDLGILGAGGVSGGIHPEQEAESLGQALRDSRCRVLFVENDEQLDKALLVRDRCPALQRIVIIDMKGLRDFADPMCESLQSFVARDGSQQVILRLIQLLELRRRRSGRGHARSLSPHVER